MESGSQTENESDQQTNTVVSAKDKSFNSGLLVGMLVCCLLGVPFFVSRIQAELTFLNFFGTALFCVIVSIAVCMIFGFIFVSCTEQERDDEIPVTIRDKHNRTYNVRLQEGWARLRDHLAENVSGQTSGWRVVTADTAKKRIVAHTDQTLQCPIDDSIDGGLLQIYAQARGRKNIYQAVVNMRVDVEIQLTPMEGRTNFIFHWKMHRANKDCGEYASQAFLNQQFWSTFDRFYVDLDNLFGQPDLSYYMKVKKEMQPWEDGLNM